MSSAGFTTRQLPRGARRKGAPGRSCFKKNINYINNLLRKATTTRQQEKSARWVGYHKIN
jgi:hypothetical protein